MHPSIANQDLSPPRQRVLAPGLLPAILAHVVLIAALAANLDWKRGSDNPQQPALASAPSTEEANDTARMGAPPMPSAAATVEPQLAASTPAKAKPRSRKQHLAN